MTRDQSTPDTVVERIDRQVGNRRGNLILLIVVLALVAVGGVLTLGLDSSQDRQIDRLQQRVQERQEVAEVLAGDVGTLTEQVERLGGEPAVPDPEERLDDIPGADPDPGFTYDQLRAVLLDYLRENPIRQGKDGRTPTQAELQALAADATVAYCAQPAEPCRGDDGDTPADGDDGQPGRDGLTPALSINAEGHLIATYEGSDPVDLGRVVAEDGKDGADSTVPGPAGAEGRGIVGGPEGPFTRDDGACVLRWTYNKAPLTSDTVLPKRFCQPDLDVTP